MNKLLDFNWSYGATRNVWIFRSLGFVFKFPRFESWIQFLGGLISNLNETETWKNDKWHHEYLCPIKFSSWGGFFLIMTYAEPVSTSEMNSLWNSGELCRYQEISMDDHSENFGKINDKIVWVDYG